jgi:hypothetical protein
MELPTSAPANGVTTPIADAKKQISKATVALAGVDDDDDRRENIRLGEESDDIS